MSSPTITINTNIKVASFEALYRLKCRSLICWVEVGDTKQEKQHAGDTLLTDLGIIHETTEKIVQIGNKIKVARNRQKRYANNRDKTLEFQAGDRVMLKVSPWNSGGRRKLS